MASSNAWRSLRPTTPRGREKSSPRVVVRFRRRALFGSGAFVWGATMQPIDDVIAAIATAPGAASLAVVRVSGRGAIATADRVFRGAAPLAEAPAQTLHHCRAVGAGDAGRAAPLDD